MKPRRRRSAHASLIAFAVLALSAPPLLAQTRVADDAKRTVAVPAHVSRVFAAGAPAEVLLYTLVPEMLVGRNHMPSAAALELMPQALRSPTPIKNLPDRDDPRYDDELLQLKPEVYIDYGTIDDDYVAALEAISSRTKVPALIFDGRLTAIPTMYRRLGTALGVPDRGEKLAAEAQRVLDKYRNSAASVRVYLACSRDSLMPACRVIRSVRPRSCSAQSTRRAARQAHRSGHSLFKKFGYRSPTQSSPRASCRPTSCATIPSGTRSTPSRKGESTSRPISRLVGDRDRRRSIGC